MPADISSIFSLGSKIIMARKLSRSKIIRTTAGNFSETIEAIGKNDFILKSKPQNPNKNPKFSALNHPTNPINLSSQTFGLIAGAKPIKWEIL
jgi:hypothetical protein